MSSFKKLLAPFNALIHVNRCFQRPRWVRPYLRDLYFRRLDQGPEPFHPRSAWPNWNTDAELDAFCHRIGERIPLSLLIRALTDRSFQNPSDCQSSCQLTLDRSPDDNSELANHGHSFTQSFTFAFLRRLYPRVPEEWIVDIADHLLSSSQLAFTAAHLGLRDLVRYSDSTTHSGAYIANNPPSVDVLATALLAVVGLVAKKDIGRAKLFARDFLIAPLVDLDVTGRLVKIEKPMQLLAGVLAMENRSPPEPRLQRQAGMNTLVACYQVGIYCDGELLGEAPGETVEIAEQEAACQAVRNLFGLMDNRPPLPLRYPMDSIDLELHSRKNVSLSHYLQSAA